MVSLVTRIPYPHHISLTFPSLSLRCPNALLPTRIGRNHLHFHPLRHSSRSRSGGTINTGTDRLRGIQSTIHIYVDRTDETRILLSSIAVYISIRAMQFWATVDCIWREREREGSRISISPSSLITPYTSSSPSISAIPFPLLSCVYSILWSWFGAPSDSWNISFD